jgi:hypothetical protein
MRKQMPDGDPPLMAYIAIAVVTFVLAYIVFDLGLH